MNHTLTKSEAIIAINEIDKEAENQGTPPIDPYIRPLVIALSMYGFSTSGSCEGHLDDRGCNPWIVFNIPLSSIPNKGKRKERLKKLRKKTKREIVELHKLLHEFYVDRETPLDQCLEMIFNPNDTPFNFFTLRSAGARVLEVYPQELWIDGAMGAVLVRYQQEMTAFAEFLFSRK